MFKISFVLILITFFFVKNCFSEELNLKGILIVI